ncbi:DNA polymerase-like protein [Vibrio sp. JCM 19236]|nr:DNA polymerase-like protein [Vibrio sp. JCM 19236]
MNLWLYLHFPSLQLDTLFAEKDHSPICIIEQHKVVQANQSALEAGIQLGTGLASAASLCSELQVAAYEPEFEQQRLLEVAQWLYLYTSDITPFPNKGLLLKVTGMLTLYRDLESYWKVISKHLDKLGLTYQYATAYSPLAAKLLAEVGANRISDTKEQIDRQLFAEPIQATELSNSNIEKLNRIGVRS